mgnify:CR=1 FL=1
MEEVLNALSEINFPLDIVRAVYLPGRKLYGFVIFLKNIPGALAKTSRVFWKNSINILYCNTVSKGEISDSFFICDFTFSKAATDEIIKQLKNVSEVLEVTVIEPIVPGFLIDYVHFPILLAGKRCLIVRQEIMKEMTKGMRDEWGSAAGVFLYHMGKRVGRLLWRAHQKLSDKIEDTIKILEALMKSTGLGDFHFEIDIKKRFFLESLSEIRSSASAIKGELLKRDKATSLGE